MMYSALGFLLRVYSMTIANAKIFAIAAHEAIGQVRKYTGDPYYTHPIAVSIIVAEYGGSDDQVKAALLHDVIEDTSIGLDVIVEQFGYGVADLVFCLTDISTHECGNREARKAIDRAHLADAPKEAQFVKCADIIHNSSSILHHDNKFAIVYMREMELLLNAMTKVHDEPIWLAAMDNIEKNKINVANKQNMLPL